MSNIEEIKKSLNSVHEFSEEQVNAFLSKLKTKKLDKKEHLLQPTNTCSFMAFIQKGSIRVYSLTEADETTLHFFTENNWVADYESFISQQPTQHYLQAIEKTEVEIITLDDIHRLMEEFPVFRNLARLMEKWVITSSHYISVANSSPDERYRALLKKNPEWINRFAQMYIASYLGMTTETLSRVKSRVP